MVLPLAASNPGTEEQRPIPVHPLRTEGTSPLPPVSKQKHHCSTPEEALGGPRLFSWPKRLTFRSL